MAQQASGSRRKETALKSGEGLKGQLSEHIAVMPRVLKPQKRDSSNLSPSPSEVHLGPSKAHEALSCRGLF